MCSNHIIIRQKLKTSTFCITFSLNSDLIIIYFIGLIPAMRASSPLVSAVTCWSVTCWSGLSTSLKIVIAASNEIDRRERWFKYSKPRREVSQSRKLKKIKMAQPAFLSYDDLDAAGILMCETRSLQYCIDVKLHDRPHQYSHSLWKEFLVENYIQHFYWHCVIYDRSNCLYICNLHHTCITSRSLLTFHYFL